MLDHGVLYPVILSAHFKEYNNENQYCRIGKGGNTGQAV